ncbi:MAG TPA: type II toxin-antitoxin system VapC family toxin [Longimicrobium sp.]|nr:type II toxin-antitoxin system VapC family toxin [Longimicrobium sp.]
MTQYALDTNLYVRAIRSEEEGAALSRFYAAFTPACFLSSIVAHELLVGATDAGKEHAVRENFLRAFHRTGRIFTPSHSAWEVAGEAIAQLVREEKLAVRQLPRSFFNDVLLAASCRESGMTLITDNVRDFARIRRALRFEFGSPWPA